MDAGDDKMQSAGWQVCGHMMPCSVVVGKSTHLGRIFLRLLLQYQYCFQQIMGM
jgi:hypothetical protein